MLQGNTGKLILEKTSAPDSVIQPGVIWVRDLFKKDYETNLYLKDRKSKTVIELYNVQKEFEEELDVLLSEIFNPDITFNPTDDADKCKYCTYRELCNR